MLTKLVSLRHHAGFMRYFKNTGWMMGEQLLRMIAGLFVGIWVARYLGPEQFGLFSYVLAFTTIFAGIAKLGLDSIMVRELVKHPEKRDVYLGTAFWLKVIGAGVAMQLLAIITTLTSNDSTTNLYIFIIAASLVFQSFEVVSFYFESQVLAKFVSICKIIQLSLSSLIKLYLIIIQADLLWFILVTLFDSISLAVSYVIAYHTHKHTYFYFNFNKKIIHSLLKDSWPILISTLVIILYSRVDQIMIKEFLGNHEVGIYSAALRLYEIWSFIPIIMGASLFPAILKARDTHKQLYIKYLFLLYKYTLIMGIAILVPIFFFSELITSKLYGITYLGSGKTLSIAILAIPFVFLFSISSKWFISENLMVLALMRNLIALLINIGLNLILIPMLGINGAALSTIISFFFSGYLFDVFSKNTRYQFHLKTKALLSIFGVPYKWA